MTRSVLVTMAQKGRPKLNVTSGKQSRDQSRWSAVQRDVLGNFASTDKYCKNKVQRRVLKYLRRKLLPPH